MSQLLNRFSLEAAKFNGQVFFCLLVIWLIMVYCAVVSINSQGFSESQRRMWLLVVICIPIFGMLAYLPFSVRREDLPQLFLMKSNKDPRTHGKKSRTAIGGRAD